VQVKSGCKLQSERGPGVEVGGLIDAKKMGVLILKAFLDGDKLDYQEGKVECGGQHTWLTSSILNSRHFGKTLFRLLLF